MLLAGCLQTAPVAPVASAGAQAPIAAQPTKAATTLLPKKVFELASPPGAVLVVANSKREADAKCKINLTRRTSRATHNGYWDDEAAQAYAVICLPGGASWALVTVAGPGNLTEERLQRRAQDGDPISYAMAAASTNDWLSNFSKKMEPMGYSDSGFLRFQMTRRRDASSYALAGKARPPLNLDTNYSHFPLAPPAYTWPSGSPITNIQLSFIALSELATEAPLLRSTLPALLASLDPIMVRELAALPQQVAQSNLHLAQLVDTAVASGLAAATKLAQTPPATYERVAAYLASIKGMPPTYQSARDGFGIVAALDPKSPCAKGIYGAVAKLMRNHDTMVLRKEGADLSYYKDKYRSYFFEKNIAAYNAPDSVNLDYASFRVVGTHGTSRHAGIEIVPNASCTSAYVKLVYFGGLTSGNKYYAISTARIDASFAKNPDKGQVADQYFRILGFGDSSGPVADFSFTCDEDTCSKAQVKPVRKP